MEKNLYEILNVSENSSPEEIKKNYRKLSMKWHPDKNPDNLEESEKIFKEITASYSILSDANKRRDYNLSLRNPFGKNGNTGVEELFKNIFSNININDFVNSSDNMPNIHVFTNDPSMNTTNFFTRQGINNIFNMNKPPPIVKTLEISFKESYTGCEYPLQITRWILQNGTKIHEEETIYVSIHQGIDENELICCKGKGNIVDDRLRGDVKIFIKVKPDKIFLRKGLDLYFFKTISLKESLCGFVFDFDHLNGQNYKINNKTTIIRPNFKKNIQKLGMKRGESEGNLIIEFNIEFPKKLSNDVINTLSEIL